MHKLPVFYTLPFVQIARRPGAAYLYNRLYIYTSYAKREGGLPRPSFS